MHSAEIRCSAKLTVLRISASPTSTSFHVIMGSLEKMMERVAKVLDWTMGCPVTLGLEEFYNVKSRSGELSSPMIPALRDRFSLIVLKLLVHRNKARGI